MNIAALRRVQETIADKTKPFDMYNPCCCIAGHLVKYAGAPHRNEALGNWSTKAVAAYLEIEFNKVLPLFFGHIDPSSRPEAIAKIEALIQQHAPTPVEEEELVGV